MAQWFQAKKFNLTPTAIHSLSLYLTVISRKSKAPEPLIWQLQVNQKLNQLFLSFSYSSPQNQFETTHTHTKPPREKNQICFMYTGLTESTCDLVDFRHVTAMADYAMQLFNKIEEVNEHSFNNFRMRIGKFDSILCWFFGGQVFFSSIAFIYLFHFQQELM